MLKRLFHYPRFLNEVLKSVDLDLVAAETIMALWDNIHSHDTKVVTKTISSMQYKRIQERLEQAPSFLFPSATNPQQTLISEVIEPNCLGFSNLEDEDSNNLLLLRLFPELASTKNIVPLRCDIIHNGLTKAEGERVLSNFCKYYLETDLFNGYVLGFNLRFEEFNYEEFIREYFKPSAIIQ